MESPEREVFEAHNYIRANPRDLIPDLEELLTFFDGNTLRFPGNPVGLMTDEGPAGVKGTIEYLKTADSLPPLEWDDNLGRAARDHASDIGPKGIVGHTGSDGSSMSDRIERYCQWDGQIAENINFGEDAPRKIVMDLIIDDGNLGRGHRKNIFNPALKKVGIAKGSHSEYKNLCVFVFAGNTLGKGEAPSASNDLPEPSGKIDTGLPSLDQDLEDIKKGIDPHAPKGTVSTKVRVNTTLEDGKQVKTMVKTYKTAEGSQKVVTIKHTLG